jgi:hypothetical protein
MQGSDCSTDHSRDCIVVFRIVYSPYDGLLRVAAITSQNIDGSR